MKSKSVENRQSLSREYSYASHHHLIPLYVLAGINLLGVLVLGCFLTVLWQNSERDSFLPLAQAHITGVENQYISTAVEPVEKKQYMFPAAVRFAVNDPYDTMRYNYEPAAQAVRTTDTFTLTTSKTLQELEAPLRNNPQKSNAYLSRLQQCARLYVIRFEPGVTTYGGFAPLQEVKLKDGRTAYIHKNASCVPTSTQAMNTLDKIEKIILSIESY